ncbi:MAG: hypothetical protein IJ157_02795 [Clostridia bacterium]|nr:hypothetical protein [Clostridia bacterium]
MVSFVDVNQLIVYNGLAAFGRQGSEDNTRGLRLLDYEGRQVMRMSAYEIMMVFIGIMNCLLIVLVAFISNKK